MKETFDVAIVGAGPGGYVAAIRCAQLGLKTVCIEKRKELGGTCLNVGCIPSKALLQSSEYFVKAKEDFKKHGIEIPMPSCNFSAMMGRKEEIVSSFRLGIGGLFKKNKVEHLVGTASFLDPHRLMVEQETGSREVMAKHIILATGSEPIPLPFLPFDEKRVLSSTGALQLSSIPKKLLIVGAGVIGVELGSVYRRLGSEVTFVEFFPKICPSFDDALSNELLSLLKKQGMEFLLSTKVISAKVETDGISCQVEPGQTLKADAVLVAIGRKPVTQGLNLQAALLTTTEKGLIPIDGRFRTKMPHIFAIGDIVEGPMLAHKASEEGVAVAEIIAGQNPLIDYMAIPSVIYTHPEVASVGMSEEEAKKANLSIKTASFPFKANSRARCMGDESGFVKVIIEEKTDRILGIHIIGASASEIVAVGALAISQKMTLSALLHTPFAHPTLSEAIKEAAMAIRGSAIHK